MASAQPSDPTFRSYTAAQAAQYSKARQRYSSKLYDFILAHHAKTGGSHSLLLDVGCGPGTATKDLAPYFQRAMGVDPGEAMVQIAHEANVRTATGEIARFVVSAAEDIDSIDGLGAGSVDLLSVAMAAHWFDMPRFWRAAGRVVESGGTVVIWTQASLYCHPDTPNAKTVQAVLSELEDGVLAPYMLPANRMSRNLYAELGLPWEVDTGDAFKKEGFTRNEWDRDGIPTDGKDFFSGSSLETVASLGKALGSASPVTRWRDAHSELAGTENDCVKVTMKKLLGAVGANSGEEENTCIRVGSSTVILCFKRA